MLSSVNVIGSYFQESTSLVETYAPYKVLIYVVNIRARYLNVLAR